jgi:TrmH family RNA methyltransferase
MIDFKNISQAQLKKLARLNDAKARQEEGRFLAEGVKVVEELLKSDWQIEALLIMPEKTKYWEKLILPGTNEIPTYQLTRSQWEKNRHRSFLSGSLKFRAIF